jgi:hypothetical protein
MPHGQLRSAVAALGITSRSLARGGTPEVIATAARGHWDIEALHHARASARAVCRSRWYVGVRQPHLPDSESRVSHVSSGNEDKGH